MVGSPFQTVDDLVEDFLFLKELDPEMVGIGPFIAHQDTPFHDRESGTLEDTLFYLALLRLMLPNVLLPATTALGYDSSERPRTGSEIRRKCCHAKSLAGFCEKEIYVVRWKDLYR